MQPIGIRSAQSVLLFTILSGVTLAFPSAERTHAPVASREVAGAVIYEGSSILALTAFSQPALIYRKYPTDQSVAPNVAWRLSFGVLLVSAHRKPQPGRRDARHEFWHYLGRVLQARGLERPATNHGRHAPRLLIVQ